jgi:hypothetical protein
MPFRPARLQRSTFSASLSWATLPFTKGVAIGGNIPCKFSFAILFSFFLNFPTGLTGFSGYLFGFPDESQKIQSPSANENTYQYNIAVRWQKFKPKNRKANIFPAYMAGLGLATFCRKVAKKRNPDNPVNPV